MDLNKEHRAPPIHDLRAELRHDFEANHDQQIYILQPDDLPLPLLGNASHLDTKRRLMLRSFSIIFFFHSPNPWKPEQEYLEEFCKLSDSGLRRRVKLEGALLINLISADA